MKMFWTKKRINEIKKKQDCSVGTLIMTALNDFEKRLIKLEHYAILGQ